VETLFCFRKSNFYKGWTDKSLVPQNINEHTSKWIDQMITSIYFRLRRTITIIAVSPSKNIISLRIYCLKNKKKHVHWIKFWIYESCRLYKISMHWQGTIVSSWPKMHWLLLKSWQKILKSKFIYVCMEENETVWCITNWPISLVWRSCPAGYLIRHFQLSYAIVYAIVQENWKSHTREY
jgi:hypothetical protein